MLTPSESKEDFLLCPGNPAGLPAAAIDDHYEWTWNFRGALADQNRVGRYRPSSLEDETQ
jgi:hypothetical protein